MWALVCLLGLHTAAAVPASNNNFLSGAINLAGMPEGDPADSDSAEAAGMPSNGDSSAHMPANGVVDGEEVPLGQYNFSPPLKFVPYPRNPATPTPTPTPSPTPMVKYLCGGGPCIDAKLLKKVAKKDKEEYGAFECDIVGKGEKDCLRYLKKINPDAAKALIKEEPPAMVETPTNLRCANHTNCTSCVMDVMCGWCSSSCSCMDGTPMGPKDMKCERTATRPWDYTMCTFDQCNDPCIPAPPPTKPHYPTSCRGNRLEELYPQGEPPPEHAPQWGGPTPTGHKEGMELELPPPVAHQH